MVRATGSRLSRLACYAVLVSVTVWGSIVLVRSHSWGHDVGEPELEKLPLWKQCCAEGDCVSQRLRIIEKEPDKKVAVEIEGVQTSVDKEKFSPVPTNRTWVCYVSPRGSISNENIRCILYPQKSGTT